MKKQIIQKMKNFPNMLFKNNKHNNIKIGKNKFWILLNHLYKTKKIKKINKK